MNPLNKMIALFASLNEGPIYMTVCNEDFNISLFSENDERIKDVKDLFIWDESLEVFIFNDEDGNY